MIKKCIIFLSFLLNINFAFANQENSKFDVNIKINGMVCEFCVTTLENEFNNKKEVKTTKVNLKTGNISIIFHNKHNMSDELITDIVVNHGYNVKEIDRNQKNR